MSATVFLTLLIFLPAIGALLVWLLVPRENDQLARTLTFAVTVAVFALSVGGFFAFPDTAFSVAAGEMQNAVVLPWIPSFDIYYFLGVDGISFPLVMLTTFVSLLAMGASWSITKHLKAYCILFLLLETGMIGVFLALDFFLFYVFWEVMLLPMYFLIGVWGGPRREYAAIKFFLYTLVGSVLMLIALLMLYFNSDVRELAKVSDFYGSESAVKWDDIHLHPSVEQQLGRVSMKGWNLKLTRQWSDRSDNEIKVRLAAGDKTAAAVGESDGGQVLTLYLGKKDDKNTATSAELVAAVNANPVASSVVSVQLLEPVIGDEAIAVSQDEEAISVPTISSAPIHTFNILAMTGMGQHTDLFSPRLQWWAFLLLFIGFLIKVPSVPVHTWLPDAHVEAPTPISMILAGVLLKMGGYGIIRICYPICPHGGYEFMYFVCGLGVVSMIYGAFAALAQTDFKRLVAYSSVSHMGYVTLGLGVWSATGPDYNSNYWNMGISGAMFQMIGHGVSSAGMFFMVGIVYDRVHHRNLNEFGGLFGKMPVYTAIAMGLFFAGLGLPGLCGFIGEVLVVLSVWNFSPTLAILSAAVVIFTAGYILWAIQRVYLGAEYRGPHEEALTPSNTRERAIGITLLIFAIIFGVVPHHTVLQYMEGSITRQVDSLTEWTQRVKEAPAYSDDEEDAKPSVKPQKAETSVASGLKEDESKKDGRTERGQTRPVSVSPDPVESNAAVQPAELRKSLAENAPQ